MHKKSHYLDTAQNSDNQPFVPPSNIFTQTGLNLKNSYKYKWSIKPLEDICKKDQRANVKEALTFGNHKGAPNNQEQLKLLVNDDVIHKFAITLTLSKIKNIKGLLFAPLNIQPQHSIIKTGKIINKDCLTYD
jgi:hypothetical protein